MNLFDARIEYFVVPAEVLRITGKIALLVALDIYRTNTTQPLMAGNAVSPYQKRRLKDVRFELLRHGVISETLEILPVEVEHRIPLPRDFDYGDLSFADVKVFIAAYSLNRYSRESFRFTSTQERLAGEANVSLQHLRKALTRLQGRELIAVEKLWREGTRITLLDPEQPSGTPIYHLAEFYREQMDDIPVHDRYKICLAQYDPKGHLENIRNPVENYQVVCPFCGAPDPKGTLRINTTESDFWFCHRCKRRGNSAKLWAKVQWRIGKDNWRSIIAMIKPDAGSLTVGEEIRL